MAKFEPYILQTFLFCFKFLAFSQETKQSIYNNGFSKANLVNLFQIWLTLFLHLALAQQPTNQFIYNGFKGANLSLDGSAKIHRNGLLELTNTSYQQIGHAFFPFPFNFNKSLSKNNPFSSPSFSTIFVFAIVPESPTRDGHGLAFTMTPSVEFKGAIATQYLGLFNATNIGSDSNHLLAVEFDTVKNPEFEDIDADHVGIDLNNLTSTDSASSSYFSRNPAKNISIDLKSGIPIQVWIEYDQTEKLLNVTNAPVPIKKPEKPLLSTRIDLSSVFMDSMYVGFSASTGSVSSHHYILGWSFNNSGEAQSLNLSSLPSLNLSSLPSLPRGGKGSTGKLMLSILLPLVIVIILIIMIVLVYVFKIRKKRFEEILEDWEQQYGPQRFSYKDLYKATKGFRKKELLGFGGFGMVYKGVLPSNNAEVAVKKVSHDSKQGMKEFIAEIASTGRLRHRNLVRLLGHCRREKELFLVYDYMPNGSLDKFLFSNEKPILDWVHRIRIIKGVASALLYLHEGWEQVVLHRDVKASNVLLDSEFNGRLGDFGLCKFHDHGSDAQTTCIVGTIGYLAPELTRTGKPTTSSDVFAFGILMLEVACGRRPIEPQKKANELVLTEWALDCWKRDNILEMVDPRFDGNYVVEEMELVLKLGLVCANYAPAARPNMRQVLQYLDGNTTLPDIGLFSGSFSASTDSISFVASTYDVATSLSNIDSALIGR